MSDTTKAARKRVGGQQSGKPDADKIRSIKLRAKLGADDLRIQIEVFKLKHKITNRAIAAALQTTPQNISQKLAEKKVSARYADLLEILYACESLAGVEFGHVCHTITN
jgi:hypothetical protein